MTDPHTRTTIVLDFLPVLFLSTSGIINADDNESSLQRGVEFLIMHCPSIIENEKDLPPPLTEGDDEDEHDKYWKTIWPKGLFENAQASNVELWYPSPTGQITYHVDTKVAESGKDGVLLPIIFHKQISPGEGLREMGPYMWEKS
ncbi:hypothetical protein EDC01DRAFT_410410 [Geopyxis carbonaria]|nr:hypothetical protein EDC01DRAFT_410410 [Geopyxis carbonaria]